MISEILKKLNIEIPNAPDPVGAYVAFKIIDNGIFSQKRFKRKNKTTRT